MVCRSLHRDSRWWVPSCPQAIHILQRMYERYNLGQFLEVTDKSGVSTISDQKFHLHISASTCSAGRTLFRKVPAHCIEHNCDHRRHFPAVVSHTTADHTHSCLQASLTAIAFKFTVAGCGCTTLQVLATGTYMERIHNLCILTAHSRCYSVSSMLTTLECKRTVCRLEGGPWHAA